MSNIRKYMVSRWPNGRILEIDYSQLEVFVLAHLSGDTQLQIDLLSGADLHCISAERLFGSGYTPAQRKIAKRLSFQLQYGSGYKAMAASNNIPEELAKKFITNYFDRYPDVKRYQDMLSSRARLERRMIGNKRTIKGYPAGTWKYVSETNRIYTFVETDAPDWMAHPKFGSALSIHTSFSPTKVKNYPNQGMATGDIVPMMMGVLHRELIAWNKKCFNDEKKVLFVNTVHDSFVFDCKDEPYAIAWWARASDILRQTPKYCKDILGFEFNMPLNCDAEIGKNWYDMKNVFTL